MISSNSIITMLMCIICLIGQAQADEIYYVHTDHLNVPTVVTNQNKEIVWQGHRKPFGETEETINNIRQPFRFPGQYFDEETGLHYNLMRDYDPSTGRYIQSDPIGLAGGVSTYGYAGANPLMYVDPRGEFFMALPLLGGISGGALGNIIGGGLFLATTAVLLNRALDLDGVNSETRDPNDDRCRRLAQKIRNTQDEIYNKRYPDLASNSGGLPTRIGPGERLRDTVRGHEKLLNRRLNELRKLEDRYEKECLDKCQ